MYPYINYLNIFLIDGRRSKARAGVETSPKSGPKKPEIAEPDPFRTLSPYVVALLGARSPSGLLKAAEPYKRFY